LEKTKGLVNHQSEGGERRDKGYASLRGFRNLVKTVGESQKLKRLQEKMPTGQVKGELPWPEKKRGEHEFGRERYFQH